MVTVPTGDTKADVKRSRQRFNFQRFVDTLRENEGRRLRSYPDADGRSVGFGFFLGRPDARTQIEGLGHDFDRVMAGSQRITPQDADTLLERTAEEAVETARDVVPSFDELNEGRQVALADMAFNLGETRFRQFKKMLAAIDRNDWKTAAEEAKNSKWYQQVTDRAERNIRLFGEDQDRITEVASGRGATPLENPILPPAALPGQAGTGAAPITPSFDGSPVGSDSTFAAIDDVGDDPAETLAAADEIERFRDEQFQGVLDRVLGTDPAKAAEADALSDLTGVEADTIQKDPEPFRQLVRRETTGAALDTAPITKRMMSDERFARQAHRDVAYLTGVEQAAQEMQFGRMVPQFDVEPGPPDDTLGLNAPGRAIRRMNLIASQMANQFFAENNARKAQDSQRSFKEIFSAIGEEGGDPNIATAAFRYLTSRSSTPEEAQERAAERLRNVGQLAEQIAATPRSQSSQQLVDEVSQAQSIQEVIAVAARNPIGIAALSGEMMVEQAPTLVTAGVAARLGQRQVSGRIARAAIGASAFAGSSFAQERLRSPADFFADRGVDLTDPAQAMAAVTDPELLQEAQDFGFTRAEVIAGVDLASGGFASIIWGTAFRTALTNALVQPGFEAAGEAGALAATGQEISLAEVSLEALGGIGTGAVEPVVVGSQQISDFRRAGRAQSQRTEMDALHEQTQQSEFVKQSPDAAAAHVAEVMPARAVYVPVEQLDRVLEELGVDEGEFYSQLDVLDQVDDARVLGSDIQFTPAQFARQILIRPEMYQALADHVRETPDAFTPAEAREFLDDGVEEILSSIPETVAVPDDLDQASADAISAINQYPPDILSPSEELSEIQERLAEAAQGEDTDIRSASAAASLAMDELGLRQLFHSAEEAGMTPATYRTYLEAVARQADGVVKRQQDKILRNRQKKNDEAVKKEFGVVEEQAREHVRSQPVYRAINAIGLERLDRQSVIDTLPNGEAQLAELPTQSGGRRIYTSKREGAGANVDMFAQMHGFPDGQSMLFRMIDAPPEDVAIQQLTEREMRARHEDLLLERDAVAAARESLHIDRTAEVLGLEVNALREAEGQGRLSRQLIRNEAQRRFGNLQLKNIRIDRFQAAQKRHAREAGRALRRGDRQAAAEHKIQQLMNFEFTRLGYKAREQVARNRRTLSKFTKKGAKFKSIDGSYVGAIQQLLAQYNLGPRLSAEQREREVRNLAQQIKDLEGKDGAIVHIPQRLLDEANTKNWQDMLFDEWEALVDGVKNLEQQGRRVPKARVQGKLLDRADVVTNLARRAEAIPDSRASIRRQQRTDPSLLDNITSTIATAGAALDKIEFMLRKLDDGEVSGPWQQAFFQPFVDAQNERNDIFSQKMIPLVKRLDDAVRANPELRQNYKKRIFVEPLGEEMRRSTLLMVALQTGNESNLSKLVRGSAMRPHAPAWTEEGVLEALQLLTPEEADWVQQAWDIFEELRPRIEQIYIDEFNVVPSKIEPKEVEVGGKTIRGGYFPMFYERPDVDTRSTVEVKAPTSALGAIQQEHVRESVFAGFLEERTNFAAPVQLDFSKLTRAFYNHIHYITHYEPVRDTKNLIKQEELQRAVADKLGPEYLQELDRWIKALATGQIDPGEDKLFNRVASQLRTNMTVAVLGASYTTGFAQMLGVFNSVGTLGLKPGREFSVLRGTGWMTRGYAQYLANPFKATQEVRQMSGEMRNRLDTVINEINDGMNKLVEPTGNKFYKAQQRAGMRVIGLAQFYTVDVPTWLAGFNQAISEGFGVDTAIAKADSIIRTSQGSGALKDRSRVQRATGIKAWVTMFSTFTQVLYAQIRESAGAPKDAKRLVQHTARMAIVIGAATFFDMLIRNEFPDEDDDENPVEAMMKRMIGFAASSVPILGRGVDSALQGFEPSLTPLQQLPKAWTNAIDSLYEALADQDEFTSADIRRIVNAFGLTFGVAGTTQMNDVLEALDEEDPEIIDFLLGKTE